MNAAPSKLYTSRQNAGFTLVEMLVVIAIMSILMTAGAIGLGGMGGKGVTSGVASVESLFDEARSIAVGQRTTARVLVAKDLDNNKADNLRRVVVASAEIDPATGVERVPQKWILSSRGVTLPDQVFFSQNYSKKDQAGGTVPDEKLTGVKAAYLGSYFYYEFNSEGISTTPGATFIIGSGARKLNSPTERPVITSAAKSDFGGFAVWRNGRTSIFRSPGQINSALTSLKPNDKF
jgi:prepilin-type N-terminal cleavage/methylation domain-containing protein